MKQLILNTLQPVIARLGTAGATLLVANGVPESSAAQVVTAAGVIAFVAYDYIADSILRKTRK